MRRLFILTFFSLSAALSGQSQSNFDSVNSVYDEQYPVFSSDGNRMYFTRANHPSNIGGLRDKGDIWYATFNEGKWSNPIHAGAIINNDKWNSVVGFSSDGNSMILHHHYQDDRQGLSISQKKNDGWTIPTSLKIPYFLNRSNIQSGSVSSDGGTILLSIESYNTKGGEDIYVLFRQNNGSWSDPKNLGVVINTAYQEISPYLAEDNKTLFFASNGHPLSKGSFDVYQATRIDDSWINWSTPTNIGNEVNTEGRESSYQYFSETKSAVYISTQDSDGYGDIKSIKQSVEIEKPIIEIDTTNIENNEVLVADPIKEKLAVDYSFKGTVKSATTDSLILATLFIRAVDNSLQLTHETVTGEFTIQLPVGNYHLGIEAKDYLSKFLTIEIDSITTNHHVKMAPIMIGETVNLKSVLFGRGTDELLSSSFDELDAVVKMMEANTSMEIALGGHTDNQGSSKLNYALSEKRVIAVKKYLQSKGIAGRRIEGKGYGGSRPIASNKNEITRKLNRRVEFTVTKK